ncbi:sulfotransferase domain-containing protein [Litoricolaceae bacterium]|nr:sulfotransferase domain-containing protein [Litorivicinaceae bacterium]
MTDIIWLASFPKSGNTWVKLILRAMNNGGELNDINDKAASASCSSKELSVKFLGNVVDTEDYFRSKRNLIFERMVEASRGRRLIVKTHCCHILVSGQSLIPNHLSKGGILIIRNPFDVVCSVMNHFGLSVSDAIELLTSNKSQIGGSTKSYPDWLISWQAFHNSWLKNFDKPLLVVRYEDLLLEPEVHYARIARFVSKDLSAIELQKLIASTTFEAFRDLEEKTGFKEKPSQAANFFNRGQIGYFKDLLSQKAINQIQDSLGTHMEKVGYKFVKDQLLILPTTLTHGLSKM